MIYAIESNDSSTMVAVGSGGTILVSVDYGEHWESVLSGTSNDLYGLAYGYAFDQDRWVAVGQNGVILTSIDGYSWQSSPPFTGNTLYGVAWAGVFIAVGAGGVMGVSADLGGSWEAKASGTTNDLYDITVDQGLYVIVGANDTVIVGSLLTLDKEVLITERCFVSGDEISTGTWNHSFSENVLADSGYGWSHIDGVTLAETSGGEVQFVSAEETVHGLDLEVLLDGTMNHVIDESVYAFHTNISKLFLQLPLTESLSILASLIHDRAITRTLLESLTVAELIPIGQSTRIREIASIIGTPDSTGILNRDSIETVTASDVIILSWMELLTDTADLSGAATDKFEIAFRVVERLAATTTADSLHMIIESVAAAFVLADVAAGGKGGSTTESLTLSDELLLDVHALCVALETAIFSAVESCQLLLTLHEAESIDLSATATPSSLFTALIHEGVAFEILFASGDSEYYGWVLNTKNFSVTQYENYPFNSMCSIGRVSLGANQNGLYRLDGDTDNGDAIQKRLKTGLISFDHLANMSDAYLTFRSNGDLLLKLVAEEKTELWYTIKGEPNLSQRRTKFSKATTATQWQFEIESIDGADIELSSIELVPIILSRRNSRR